MVRKRKDKVMKLPMLKSQQKRVQTLSRGALPRTNKIMCLTRLQRLHEDAGQWTDTPYAKDPSYIQSSPDKSASSYTSYFDGDNISDDGDEDEDYVAPSKKKKVVKKKPTTTTGTAPKKPPKAWSQQDRANLLKFFHADFTNNRPIQKKKIESFQKDYPEFRERDWKAIKAYYRFELKKIFQVKNQSIPNLRRV